MASAIFHGHGSLSSQGMSALLTKHYLRRKPPMTDTFEWWQDDDVVGVCTFGVPASRHLQIGACPSEPNAVVELNRLWLDDALPHGSASWFISRCLREMPPRIVVSYADTAAGHDGTVYRAANFRYAGWTDMDRRTPRYDYVVAGKHSRDAFRSGAAAKSVKTRRKPKARYWTVTGDRRDRRRLTALCEWPDLSWVRHPVPKEHMKMETHDDL